MSEIKTNALASWLSDEFQPSADRISLRWRDEVLLDQRTTLLFGLPPHRPTRPAHFVRNIPPGCSGESAAFDLADDGDAGGHHLHRELDRIQIGRESSR